MTIESYQDRFGVPPDIKSWMYADAYLRHEPRPSKRMRAPLGRPHLPMFYRRPIGDQPGLILPLSLAYSLITSTSSALGPNGGSTAGVNSTGCDLIVVAVSCFGGSPSTAWISDTFSQSNWTFPSAAHSATSANVKCLFFYAWNATGGNTHQITISASGIFVSAAAFFFSGSKTSSDPNDQANRITSGADSGAGTAQANSNNLVPGFDNELMISAAALSILQSAAPTVDSSYATPTPEWVQFASGSDVGICASYQVQTTATTRNPTFTFDTAGCNCCSGLSFQAGAAAAGDTQEWLGSYPPAIRKDQFMPRLSEPADILGVTVMALIECKCGGQQQIMLVQSQKAVCDHCGRIFNLDRVEWSKNYLIPVVELTATASRGEQLAS